VSESPSKREPQSLGRAYLVKQLQKAGFSRRQSVDVITVILDQMITALRRGEAVEFPFGKLVRVRKSFGEWWDSLHDWPANREPYTVECELSPEGREQLNGPLGKEERACLKALWEAPAPEKGKRRRGGR
jgi:hypothetical protein